MALKDELKCTLCESTEICFGYLGSAANVFVPTGTFTIHGYRTRAYVCLNCGHLGHYISMDKLEKLRNKLNAQYEE
ncbi:MAG: hypothetical protein GY757_31520 [bacterium]|nr:hypothetical protein [bacterium]